MNEINFGQYLKELRLNKKIGLRKFADTLGVKASEYSDVERNRKPPFTCHKILGSICCNLDLTNIQYDKLLHLVSKKFKKSERKFGIICHATRIDGTTLDANELIELNEYIKNI